MKERPILFFNPMVRALLDGTKTQTRRVAKLTDAAHVKEPNGHRRWHPGDPNASKACPYGQPGDRLWVRETWAHDAESLEQCRASFEDAMGDGRYGPYYLATESAPDTLHWKPSIHMPRWASRITLEITRIRIERLQAINEVDAIAEGAPWAACGSPQDGSHKAGYAKLWESINGPGSWEVNPLVWVIEFKVLKGNGA